jgi:REP element-mobilizing transposase RayT
MHSFSSSLRPCIFATKAREPSLSPKIRDRRWPYLGGIGRENAMKALAIGGVADHIHILLSLPATMSVAKAMQLLKREFLEMDSRNVCRVPKLCLAGRLWGVQHWRVWS